MEAEFKHFCNVMINVINERDWKYENPEAWIFKTQHISPDFQARFDSSPWSQSFEEQTESWRQLTIDYPKAYLVLDGVDVVVLKDRTADVLMRTTMFRGDVRLLTACLTQWKFTKGRWQWYCHCGVRGISCESD